MYLKQTVSSLFTDCWKTSEEIPLSMLWYKAAKPLWAQLLTRPSFNTLTRLPLFCLIYIPGKRLLLNYLKQPACLFTWLKTIFAGKPISQQRSSVCSSACEERNGDGVWSGFVKGTVSSVCTQTPFTIPHQTHIHLFLSFISHLSPFH